jgi:hypothetical protein
MNLSGQKERYINLNLQNLKLVKADPGKNLDQKKFHEALPFNALSLIEIQINT